jgi:hypothetical protein
MTIIARWELTVSLPPVNLTKEQPAVAGRSFVLLSQSVHPEENKTVSAHVHLS